MMSLAWPLFRVTEQAALAAWPQTGCGDKNKIDGLAVTAMRQALNDVAFRGRVVIGEGEIDHAPMLWIGEEVGKGDGPEVDIAVDPIEGTRMVAMGQSNALAVMAFAPRDSLLHAPDMYMKKLVVNRLAAGAIDLSLPLTDNLRNVAKALGKPLDKLRMVTLDKPRLSAAIEEATQLGVKVFALPDGDVAASVLTCWQDNPYDVMYTTVHQLTARHARSAKEDIVPPHQFIERVHTVNVNAHCLATLALLLCNLPIFRVIPFSLAKVNQLGLHIPA